MRITFTVGISLLSDDPSINLIWRHQQHLNRTHGIVLDLDRSGAFQWCAMKLAVVLWDLAFWENATANWNANYGVSLSLHNKLNQLMRLSLYLSWLFPVLGDNILKHSVVGGLLNYGEHAYYATSRVMLAAWGALRLEKESL